MSRYATIFCLFMPASSHTCQPNQSHDAAFQCNSLRDAAHGHRTVSPTPSSSFRHTLSYRENVPARADTASSRYRLVYSAASTQCRFAQACPLEDCFSCSSTRHHPGLCRWRPPHTFFTPRHHRMLLPSRYQNSTFFRAAIPQRAVIARDDVIVDAMPSPSMLFLSELPSLRDVDVSSGIDTISVCLPHTLIHRPPPDCRRTPFISNATITENAVINEGIREQSECTQVAAGRYCRRQQFGRKSARRRRTGGIAMRLQRRPTFALRRRSSAGAR